MNAVSINNQLIQKTNDLILAQDYEVTDFINILYNAIKQVITTPEEIHFVQRFGLIVDLLNEDYAINDNIKQWLMVSKSNKMSINKIHEALESIGIPTNEINKYKEDLMEEKQLKYEKSLFFQDNILNFTDTQILKKRYNHTQILNYLIFNNQFIFEKLLIKVFAEGNSQDETLWNLYAMNSDLMNHIIEVKIQNYKEVNDIFHKIHAFLSDEIKKGTKPVENIKHFFQAIKINYNNKTFRRSWSTPEPKKILNDKAAYFFTIENKRSNQLFSNLMFAFCWVQGEQNPRIYFHKDNLLITYTKYPYCMPHALELYSNQMMAKEIKSKIFLLKENKNPEFFQDVFNLLVNLCGAFIDSFVKEYKSKLTDQKQTYIDEFKIKYYRPLLNKINQITQTNKNDIIVDNEEIKYLENLFVELMHQLKNIKTLDIDGNYINGFNMGYSECYYNFFGMGQIKNNELSMPQNLRIKRYIGLVVPQHTFLLQNLSKDI